MKWFKVSLVLGIALLVSIAAFGGTTDQVAFNCGFSWMLNVYAGSNWSSVTINNYNSQYFQINDMLRVDIEAPGYWRVDCWASVTGGAANAAVLNAFEIGPSWVPGHWYPKGPDYDWRTVDVSGAWQKLLWGDNSEDKDASNAQLFLRWDLNDLHGVSVGGGTYLHTVYFRLVSP